ncbi:synaptic vesicle transporter [Xylona heveae TC161]|uniref:Synaptic vesicle transporter n=1 Tax=Xylona heveae (strain CBS 132557 / TC161) TaxID=1328760 RepID=A0A165HB24_XYLHT|nr:synaptic vesicle transporter [Xylona heveae TC161]KZF23239.1 synaptic vesicle transporter [Xylona heveae TC161]
MAPTLVTPAPALLHISASQSSSKTPSIELQTATPSPLIQGSQASLNNAEPNGSAAVPDDFFVSGRFPTWRKILILFTTSWITLAATFSSTSLFPAVPEIADEFGTVPSVVNYSNAAILVAMGLASYIWGPMSMIIGRRSAYNIALFIFFAFAIGAALAPNLQTFVAMRTLAGFEASFFMVAGQAIIADIFDPLHRGTATGFFMCGTVTGPALGPCIGGIIVTFVTWRAIFWLQAGMAASGLILSLIFVPSITRPATEGQATFVKSQLLSQFSPMRVLELLIYPNILLTDIACGCLSFTLYSLLTPPRYLINPRFHLTTPLVSGLFYIAPGAGFFSGVLIGGRWADMTVKRYIVKREGTRLPQDRLNSGVLAFFFMVPAATLVFGWSLQYVVGGLPVPTIAMFFSGMGLMFAFSSLNTYCAEVMPGKRVQVITGKYFIQYCAAAAGSASILPLINKIGVGPACTFTSGVTMLGGVLVLITARKGSEMQRWVDQWRKSHRDHE